MLKGLICPKCAEHALPWQKKIFAGSYSKLHCQICDEEIRINRATSAAIVVIAILLANLLTGYFGIQRELAFFLALIPIMAAHITLSPLLPVHGIHQKQDASPLAWYQSPLLWLGIPVLAVIAYGLI